MRTSYRFTDCDRLPQANITPRCAFFRDEPQQSTPDTPETPDCDLAAPRYAGLGLFEDITREFAPDGPRGGRQGSLAPMLHRSMKPIITWLRKNPRYHGRYGQMPKARLHDLMAAAGIARSTRYGHLAHLREQGILRDGAYGMVDFPGFNDPDTWAHHARLTRQKTARMRRYRGTAKVASTPKKVRDSDSAPNRMPLRGVSGAKFGMWCQSSSIGLRLGKAAAAYRRTPRLWGNGRGTRVRLAAACIDHQDPAWLATLDAIAAATAAAPLGKILSKNKQPAKRASKAPQATSARSKIVPEPNVEGASAPVGFEKMNPRPKAATAPTSSQAATMATTASAASTPPMDAIRARALKDKQVVRSMAKFMAMLPPGVNLDAVDEDDPPPPRRVPKPPPRIPWEQQPIDDAGVREFNKLYGLKLSSKIVMNAKVSYWALSRGHFNALRSPKVDTFTSMERVLLNGAKQVMRGQWSIHL